MKTKFWLAWMLMSLIGVALPAQNAPVVTAGSVVDDGSVLTVPVTVRNFNNIGSFNLKLTYNPALGNALAVAKGPALGGNLAYNVGIPGEIRLGWYTWPGISMEDNAVLVNITFTRIAPGPFALTWLDDGQSCQWWNQDGDPMNDRPMNGYYFNGSVSSTTDAPIACLPVLKSCPGTALAIPLTVYSFNQIGKLELSLQYDPQVLTFRSLAPDPAFPGLTAESNVSGTLVIRGNSAQANAGITIAPGETLGNLLFDYAGGTTSLSWTDPGASCEFYKAGESLSLLVDVPVSAHYLNGSVSEHQVPEIAGNILSTNGLVVTQGQTGVVYQVPAIAHATDYVWTLPEGAVITDGWNTNTITVAFNLTAKSGFIQVAGHNECHTGPVSAPFEVTVNLASGINDQAMNRLTDIQVWPNPFNDHLNLQYTLTESGSVTIEWINVLGESLITVREPEHPPGNYQVSQSAGQLAPGVYFCRIDVQTASGRQTTTVRTLCSR